MASLFVLVPALLSALSNLLIRKSMDHPKANGADPFLTLRFLAAAALAPFLSYIQFGTVSFDLHMLLLGVVGGAVLVLLQLCIEESLRRGPAAKTFVITSAACVITPIIMFYFFGQEFGHSYTVLNFVGACLVVLGLVWMAKKKHDLSSAENSSINVGWVVWIVVSLIVISGYQALFQWRALLFRDDLPASSLIPFHCSEADGDCFMISMYFTAALCHYLYKGGNIEKLRQFSPKTYITQGIFGGVLMGLSGFVLLRITELATTDIEKIVIFPLFSVALIFFCSFWGSYFYKEKVNWSANMLCATGIAVNF